MSLVTQITALATAIGVAVKASRNRANHTGTQPASTISDFNSAVAALSGGGSPIESTIVTLPQTRTHEVTIARIGTLASQNIRAWLGSTTDNELWQLEGVAVHGECQADAISLFIDCMYVESGDIKIIYQVI